jgi:type I restriction enzyme S subunit
LCLPTEQSDPTASPEKLFRYIDISAIDKDAKRITIAPEILGAEAPSRARKAVRAGDVLVSTVRPNLNAVAVVPDELDGEIASTGFCVLRASPKLAEGKFIFYRCRTPEFVNSLVAQMRGANYPAVSDGVVKRADTPLPSPKEQRRIVELLEQADGLRRKRTEADRLANHILPALFRKMFGDPVANDKGWPAAWFGEIAESRLGKMLDAKQQTGEHRRPYLRNLNVQWARFDLSSVLEMDFPPEQRNEFLLRQGDLLICEGGEVGRSAIWDEQIPECYFQKALHRVRPHTNKCVAEYLLYLLWALARRGGLIDLNSKATIPHLTGVQLAALQIPLPPVNLQRAFAGLVQRASAVTQKRLASGNKLEALFRTMLHRAFTGDLTAKWHEAHLKELLAEMEQQARLLESAKAEAN